MNNFQAIKDVPLKLALDRESSQRDLQIPFGKFQYVDVIFLAANTDQAISHSLNPVDPNSVRFIDVSHEDLSVIYRSSSVSRQPWTSQNIYLRCNNALVSTRLLLFLEA